MIVEKEIINVRVQTKSAWSAADWTDWTVLLEAVAAENCVAPAMPAARLRHHYGLMRETDGTQFPVGRLADLKGHFVRLVYAGDGGEWVPVWHGVITDAVDEVGGEDQPLDAGIDVVHALGLEITLRQADVTGSVIEDGGGGAYIDTPMTFNLPAQNGLQVIGNRSASKKTHPVSGKESYVFSEGSDVWTAQDIIEYLLVWHADSALAWTVSGAGNLAAATHAVAPPRNVYEGIARLANPATGHTFRAVVDASGNPVIEVYPTFGSDVTVGATTLTANANKAALNLDSPSQVSLRKSLNTSRTKVIARGSPILLLGTLSYSGGHLAPGWTAAEETAYEAASELERTAEAYAHVFTTHVVDDASLPPGPSCNADGSLDAGTDAARYQRGTVLLRQIPLADHTGDFRKPFAVVQIGANYYISDQLGKAVLGGVDIPLHVLDTRLGVRLDARPNYLLAANHYTGQASDAAPTAIDYETLELTASWPSTERLRVEQPLADMPSTYGRPLVIDVPDAQCWYRLADTVTDVAGGSKTTVPAAAELRNDKALLEGVCAVAKAWYGHERAAAEIRYEELLYDLTPGFLLEKLTYRVDDEIAVNTLVTRVSWDFEGGRTAVETDFHEADYAQMARRLIPRPDGQQPAALPVIRPRLSGVAVRTPGGLADLYTGDGEWTGSYSGAAKSASAKKQADKSLAIQHIGPREVDGDATTVKLTKSIRDLWLDGTTLKIESNHADVYFDATAAKAIRGHFYKEGSEYYDNAAEASCDLSGLVSGKVGNHDLLNASEHPDTTDSTVVRGDLVVGNSTPAWTRLARGSDGQVLTVSGDDIAWADASGGASGNGVHSHNSEIKADVAGTWTLDDDYDYRGCIVLLYYANLGAGGGGGDSQVVLAPTQKRISDPPSADVMLITLGPDGPDIYVDKDDGSLYFTTTAGVADPYQIWVEASSNPARETFD